jgi:hypothetical protein
MSDAPPPVRDDPGPPSTADEAPMTTSDRLRLLSPARRRAVLDHLRTSRGGPVDVGSVATHVSEAGHAPDAETARISLRSVDLPKLDDVGVVDYDRSEGDVVYRGDDGVEALLDVARRL